MKIQKRENDKDEMLPGFVRELILQDRGNSLYLSDSFANLPSPVNETQNLKQLFKAKDNEEDFNKNGGGAGRQQKDKDSNIEIRIEGKDQKGEKGGRSGSKKDDESMDKKAAQIDVKDIEKIVFNCYGVETAKKNDNGNQSNQSYVEEESYVNPSNIDYLMELDFEEQRLKSIANPA